VTKSRAQTHEFLDPEEWESWGALMLLHRSVLQGLDTELRRAHGLAVTEFDVLITLFNAPDKRLRMSDLANRVLLVDVAQPHVFQCPQHVDQRAVVLEQRERVRD